MTSRPGDGYQITMMVDSGSSGHSFLFVIPGLQGLMHDYFSLTVSYKIATTGQYVLEGIATSPVRGHVTDVNGAKRRFTFPVVVVPGLGRNMFSVAMSPAAGIVFVFDPVRPWLEMGGVVLSMAWLGDDQTLYSFSMDLVRDSDGAAVRVEYVDLWHRRMGHVDSKSMAALRKVPDNGSSTTELSRRAMFVQWGKVHNKITPNRRLTTCNDLSSSSPPISWDP